MKRFAVILSMLILTIPISGKSESPTGSTLTRAPETTLGIIKGATSFGSNNFFYITMEGESQNNISNQAGMERSIGTLAVPGHENEIVGVAFDWAVSIPRDPKSGQPTGTRVHQPITFIKVWDKASPLLLNSITTGERLKNVVFNFYRKDSSSSYNENYFRIELLDAVVVNSRPVTTERGGLMEEISLTYRKIIMHHLVGGTSAEDDWRVPRGR